MDPVDNGRHSGNGVARGATTTKSRTDTDLVIVTGVSGATGGSSFVLTAGLAGAVASALSMATGAFLAERSEAEGLVNLAEMLALLRLRAGRTPVRRTKRS